MNLPNKLTLSRIILSPIFMALFLIDNLYTRYLALLVFSLAALTDVYDGYLARKTGVITNFGKFMDPLADKLLTSMAFISLVALGYAKAWMIIVIVGREFFITGLRSIAAYKGIVIFPSILAQVKTASQMLVIFIILVFINLKMTLLPAGYNWTILTSPKMMRLFDGMILVCVILTVATGIDYLVKNGAILKGVLR